LIHRLIGKRYQCGDGGSIFGIASDTDAAARYQLDILIWNRQGEGCLHLAHNVLYRLFIAGAFGQDNELVTA
jgi:hypothetical protein